MDTIEPEYGNEQQCSFRTTASFVQQVLGLRPIIYARELHQEKIASTGVFLREPVFMSRYNGTIINPDRLGQPELC